MAQHPEIRITKASGKEYLSHTVSTVSAAFDTDPVFHYFLNNSPSATEEHALRTHLMTLIFSAASSSSGIFYEASISTQPAPTGPESLAPCTEGVEPEPRFHCAAIVMPPGKATDAPGLLGWLKIVRMGLFSLVYRIGLARFYRVLFEYPALFERPKHTALAPSETYYYVLILGTDNSYRSRGLCSKLMIELQKEGQKEMKPVWLEATTATSRELYQKLGWEDVVTSETEEGGGLVLGRGKSDEEGNDKRGVEAKGVTIWPMVWWPDGYEKGRNKKSI
ncbi:hypothetical protein K504DRAFT_461709 [Pleomassaria siparia CBS 279.74]|uniref:Uncharacterized protein n=1 Tax=Pleomassaria siparia CBS 279.74 TaxID=1314801 RepID=A0A6G1KJP6_9PLEO|nr:hypothetical protein K504DRAFT_461709 [Pleomassaria siparia CBS 279.74]